jgi:hypothetical protein
MAPVFAIWAILESVLFVAERVLGLGDSTIAVIVIAGVLAAALLTGILGALRQWPQDWVWFAVIVLVAGQFFLALFLQINWPASANQLQHGYFNVFFAFFLGTAANFVASLLIATIAYWCARRIVGARNGAHAT